MRQPAHAVQSPSPVPIPQITLTHMPSFSPRFLSLPPYPLADVPALKRELIARGVDLIDLGVGDADLAPPPAAVEALQRAAADPANSRYSFQLGLPAFRESIAGFMKRRFGVALDPFSEVLPLIGSKEGIFHLPFAMLGPDDVAIIPDPGYQAYLGGTVLSGGTPWIAPLRAENDFLVPLEDIPSDIAARARILYLNYPNNPTTAEAPRDYLRSVIEFCHRHDILLAYDNAYSEIAYDGYSPPSILEIDGAKDVAIEFHSLSKSFNMTGWRIGWAAGNEETIAALARVKTFADTGLPFTIQHAGVAALETAADWLPGNVDTFRVRRDAAVRNLLDAGFRVEAPRSTMYLWIPTPDGEPSGDFARRLLLDQGIAVLPGLSLGEAGEGFFRIALTVPEARIRDATLRIASAIA